LTSGWPAQLHRYTAPGDGHGIFEFPAFYEMEVNDEKLVDCVTRLITGEPIDDVHCDECVLVGSATRTTGGDMIGTRVCDPLQAGVHRPPSHAGLAYFTTR
jgi:hypothetical protein